MTTTGKATVARDLLLYEPHYQNTRRRAPVAIMAALRIDREVLPVGNGFLVVGNTSNYPNAGPVLIGDGKRFRPHPRGKLLFQGGPVLWAGHTNAVVTRLTATEWEIQCGQRSRKVAELAPGQRDRILAAASFNDEVPWKREPHSLARDSRGTYYYVDRYRKEHGGRHFRVFIGRRGAMKLSRLKNVVNDTKGTIFSTQRGELRLVVDDDGDGTAVWIRGRRRTRLTTVPLSKNLEFIYGELGVYLGQKLGHVCEL